MDPLLEIAHNALNAAYDARTTLHTSSYYDEALEAPLRATFAAALAALAAVDASVDATTYHAALSTLNAAFADLDTALAAYRAVHKK